MCFPHVYEGISLSVKLSTWRCPFFGVKGDDTHVNNVFHIHSAVLPSEEEEEDVFQMWPTRRTEMKPAVCDLIDASEDLQQTKN